jgi:pimeloyl-ACP methyl ester carboxylesterase
MQRREFIGLAAGALAASAWGARLARASRTVGSTRSGTTLDAAAFHAARQFVATSFGDVACVERGSGKAALFLHGFPLNGFQWRGALERLSPYRRCIAPDFLGLGYTRVAPGQAVTPDAQVAMLAELLDRWSIASVDLVANDSGGAVAQLFAVRHPQRVRTLLLTNCDTEHHCPPPAMKPVLAMAHRGTFVSEWLAPWLADKNKARSAEGLGGMTFTFRDHPSDEAIETYLAPLVASPARTHAYALGLERNALAGIGSALARSAIPTRIVWGTGDTIFPPEGATFLDRAFAQSRGVRWIDGARLFFPEEFPEVITEEARKLWRTG